MNASRPGMAEMEKVECAAADGEERMTPVTVTLLSGFLGAGKTTLLNTILQTEHGMRIAVIENEFAEADIDRQIIGDRASQITTLANGCICCSRASELESTLLELLDSRQSGALSFDRLIIESTGMADPGPVIRTFSAIHGWLKSISWMVLLLWSTQFTPCSNWISTAWLSRR